MSESLEKENKEKEENKENEKEKDTKNETAEADQKKEEKTENKAETAENKKKESGKKEAESNGADDETSRHLAEAEAELKRIKKGRKTRETVASVIVLSMPAVLPYIISRMQYGLLMFRRCFTLYTFLILLINIVYYIHLAQREAEMKYGVEASEEKKKRLAVTVQLAVAAAFVMTAVTLFMIFTVCTMSISYLPGFARC